MTNIKSWKTIKLGKLFEFKNGVNAEKSSYGQGIKFINVMEIIKNNVITADKIPGKITLDPKQIDDNLVKNGDILFNRTSETPGEIGLTSVYLDTEKVVFGGFVIRARSKTEDLDNRYKKYCFASPSLRREIIRSGQGVVRMNIGQGDLSKISISIPSRPEQGKIAETIEVWDNYEQRISELIDLKMKRGKWLKKNLLTGHVRLPGFGKEWNKINLGEILKERKEKGIESSELALYSLTIEKGVCPKSKRYDRSFLVKSDSKNYKKSYKNDIVYNPANLRFGAIAQNKNSKPVLLSPIYQVLSLKDEEKYDVNFIAQLLTSPRQIRKMSAYAEGTLIERMEVKIEAFKLVQIQVPDYEEQTAIAQILTTADQEIETLEKKRKLIEAQKKFLLNNLVTGKIRLPEFINAN